MDEVAAATVDLPKKQGRGVLVAGNLILTAAHCVYFETSGSMALGSPVFERVRTARGELTTAVRAIEPVSDVAVLGSPDAQEFYAEAEAFEAFCENTESVRLCVDDFQLFEGFPVRIHGLGGE